MGDPAVVTVHIGNSHSGQSQRSATVTPVRTLDDVPLRKAQPAVLTAQSEAMLQAAVVKANTSDPAIVLMAKRSVILSIHPETARLTAYVNFWLMVALAYFTTMQHVDADLDNSPLVQMFGYNNVCVYWDYSPATEVTAMFYPVVEIPLVLYIVLNFLRVRECFRAGQMSALRYGVISLFVPVEFVLVLWFRMIFVVHAFDDVQGHTLGFHGLMIALCLVSVQNYLYHDSIEKRIVNQVVSIGYLVALFAVTAVKMVIAWSIFAGTPLWSQTSPNVTAWNRFAHAMDISWMILAALIPIGIAWANRKKTPAMDLAFGQSTAEIAAILEKRGDAF